MKVGKFGWRTPTTTSAYRIREKYSGCLFGSFAMVWNMSIDIPSREDLAELSKHRDDASISLYITSSSADGRPPIGNDTDAARLALRSARTHTMGELESIEVSKDDREAIENALEQLESDRNFWATQARTIAVFAAPGFTRAYRLRNELPSHTAVGDRFDIGSLLRATTFSHSGYVLAVTEGDVRLLFLGPDASSMQVELPEIPEELVDALHKTVEDGGRFDRRSADGTLGPKVEQRAYCSAIQDRVLEVIGDSGLPLVIAVAADLEPAYREINTYKGLVAQGIHANPSSLSLQDLESRGREIMDQHFADELAEWRENFGTLRANGRASAQLSDIAKAATSGLVDTLLFDLEADEEGSIDEAGHITFAPEPGPTTYGLVDEIAVRVLRTGGNVKAVRSADLPDDAPVAAVFRGTAS